MKAIWDFIKYLFGGAYPYRRRISDGTVRKIQEKWRNEVFLALHPGNPSQLKQALVTADKLLDTALGELVEGESMSSKLKNSQNLFEWEIYDKLWKAHKVRNALVHDLDYEPTYYILEEAINDFKIGLSELGIRL